MRRLVAGVVLMLVAAAAAALTEPSPAADLARVREEARELEARLRALQERQDQLGSERERLETELALAAVRVRESEAERDALVEAEAKARSQAEQAQRDLEAAIDRLTVQVGLLVLLGRPGTAPLLVEALGADSDVRRRVTVALALTEDSKLRRDEVAAMSQKRTAAVAELSQRRAELDEATAEAVRRQGELTATRSRVLAELASLERERRAGAANLATVRESEARLERLWGVVTQGQGEDGDDVRLLRGALPWPADGALLKRPFGKQRDPRYGTVTVSHGIELEVSPGVEVHAIASGTVAYSQFFKGYGNLVIVHHGGDVYSLYAGLTSMLVSANRRVRIGDAVGLAGPAEPGDGNLYLEIRVGQRPEDPLKWLRPAEKRGRS